MADNGVSPETFSAATRSAHCGFIVVEGRMCVAFKRDNFQEPYDRIFETIEEFRDWLVTTSVAAKLIGTS
jgi:hypothetical protein